MSKYIFVDIDGPLLPGKMHLFPINKKITRQTLEEAQPMFDPFAVRCFNLWQKYSDAKIVFSTNWETHNKIDADHLKMLMELNGLKFTGSYHETCITAKRFTPSRGSEIFGWLMDNAKDGDSFIAVDDDSACSYIESYMDNDKRPDGHPEVKFSGKWIEVDFMDGMSYANFIDGCEVLGIDLDDINEQEFGVKKLTAEEKQKRKEALDMLIHCMV